MCAYLGQSLPTIIAIEAGGLNGVLEISLPVFPFFDVRRLASYRSAFTENSSRSAAFLEKKQQVLRASENPGVFTMKCRIKFEFAVQEEFYKYTPTDTGMEICQYFGVENWQHNRRMTPDEVTSYYMGHWSVLYVALVSKLFASRSRPRWETVRA